MSETSGNKNSKPNAKFQLLSRALTSCVTCFQNCSYDLQELTKLQAMAPQVAKAATVQTQTTQPRSTATLFTSGSLISRSPISTLPDPSSIATAWVHRVSTSMTDTTASLGALSSSILDALLTIESFEQSEVQGLETNPLHVVHILTTLQQARLTLQELLTSVRTSYDVVNYINKSSGQFLSSHPSREQSSASSQNYASLFQTFSMEDFQNTLQYQETLAYTTDSLISELSKLYSLSSTKPSSMTTPV